MKLYYYDLETFFDCFLFTGKFEGASEYQVFEISWRMNDRDKLLAWLSYLQNCGAIMVGFNNLAFDYPIIHELLTAPYTFDYTKAFQKAQQIIHSQNDYGNNPHMIWQSDRIIPQIDWVKVNHFDNKSKRTSLKALQFAMRSPSVEDLPFDFRSHLESWQIDMLRAYNLHDVMETERFGDKCQRLGLLTMRQELLDNGILTGDVMNYSDVKIGTEYLIKKIGRHKCFVQGQSSKKRQTFRTEVPFKDVILPNISFRTERFNEVFDWFKKQTIYINSEDKSPSLEATLAGLKFKFGVGGVHASVESKTYFSSETHVIKDIDVSGMYVAVGIANGFAPEHLGTSFSEAYRQLKKDRDQYPKGSTMNKTLKLAGNGAYGNSNNLHSCFYDPKYTFSVTVNGQLQLLQLAESLALIPGLELIQCNTDGITALVPKEVLPFFNLWKADWEHRTGLVLEEVEYSKMFIRDVNNYLAVTTDGKIKRKGAYWYPIKDEDYWGGSGSEWHKDFSNLSAAKCAEYNMLYGFKIEEVIKLISDPFDFMLREKTPAGAKIFIGDKEMPKTVRYYVSTQGQPMKKQMQPKGEIGTYKRKNGITDSFYKKILSEIPKGAWDARIHTKNESKYAIKENRIAAGRLVKCCNRAEDFNWSDVDYDYYIKEIEKLVIKGA